MGRNQYNLMFPDDKQDQRLRDQLSEGCRLAKDLDEWMRSIPPGKLGEASSTQLRCSLAIASAEAISAFNEAIKLLLISTNYPSNSTQITATKSSGQCVDKAQKKAFNSALGKGSAAAEQGPRKKPLLPHGIAANYNVGWINSKKLTPSPPRSINSPTSEMSDVSPSNDAAETAETAEVTCTANARKNPRKRKLLSMVTLKVPAGNLDQGGDSTPPDDGHTWRKYGQKEILGARFPRGYYRCTHKTDLGCPAVKQVQRCEEDCSVFDVTYRGHHTCRSVELENQCWPFAFHNSLFPFPNHIFPSINANAPKFPEPYPTYQASQHLAHALTSVFGNRRDDSLLSLLQPTMATENLAPLETLNVPEGSGEPTSPADNSRDSSANDGNFELQLNTSKGTSTILGSNHEKGILDSKQSQVQGPTFTPMEDWPIFKHRDYAIPSLTTSEAMTSPQATSTGPSRDHEQVRSFAVSMVHKEENTNLLNDHQDDVPNSSSFDNMDFIGFFATMDSDQMP